MAIFNEILAGRFARAIQRVFSMKGRVPTPQVSGEVAPNFNIDNMMGLENRILQGVRSFTRSTAVASAAGVFAAWRLRNPSGSNVVAVIEKFIFAAGAAGDQPFITRGPTGTGDLTTADSANVSIRDLRLGPTSGSLVASSGTAAAPVGVQQIQIAVPANQSYDGILYENQEIVVAPGDLITVWSHVVNQTLAFTIMWRERVLEESETLVVG